MKYSSLKHIFPCFLTICILLCISGVVTADNTIYVNTGENKLAQELSESYAIGSDGTQKLVSGDTVVITGSGLETISSIVGATGDAIEGVGTTTISIPSETVRVGLYYYYSSSRNTSVETCTVSNYVGSGFNFGYHDSDRNFVKLGSTTETSLLVMRDTNVSTSAGTVGAYHIKLSGSYSTYDAAKAAASSYSGGFPAYYNGTFYALAGNYSSTTAAQSALDSLGVSGEVYTASSKAITVVKAGTTNVIFEFDYGSTQNFSISPISSSGTKAITTVAGESDSGYRYYGDFTFFRYKDLDMSVVNYVNIEDYTKGVIPYEMSSSWPIEALKAQALCARTYVATNFNQYGSVGFDVTNDTYSQVYRGTNSANSTTDAAVDETANLFVTYNGKLCTTFYFSSDGGATENSENVFYTALPYLIGKYDPYEEDITFTYKTWDYSFTASEITAKLTAKGYSISTIAGFDAEKTDVGNMKSLTFYDSYGNKVELTRTNLYGVLGLPSINYDITYNSTTGKYEIEGGGWGHNVGMSQWGAYSMAKIYNFSYADIICFYFTDVDISKGVY